MWTQGARVHLFILDSEEDGANFYGNQKMIVFHKLFSKKKKKKRLKVDIEKMNLALFFSCVIFSKKLHNRERMHFHHQNPFLKGSKYFLKLQNELLRFSFFQKMNYYDLVVSKILKKHMKQISKPL